VRVIPIKYIARGRVTIAQQQMQISFWYEEKD
jgi:hypothetical protein